MRSYLVPLLVAVLVGAGAQTQAADDTNTQGSVGYEYRRLIKERLRGFGDLVYEQRFDSDFLAASQDVVSTTGGVSYDLGKRWRFEGGLGLYYTDRSDLPDTFETRLWQSVTVDWPETPGKVRRVVFHHRFRLEERFRNTEDWEFALRLRYRLAFSIPLNRYTVEPGAFYLPLKAEFYVPLGDDVEELLANQARYGAGIGYVFDKSWRAELRYSQLRQRDTIDVGLETTDHYIELRVKSAFRIVDLIKGR